MQFALLTCTPTHLPSPLSFLLCRHGDGFSSLSLIKERALDVLTISARRNPLFQYLSLCRHQKGNL